MLAKEIKLDPTIMVLPLITTTVDNCSILIYFVIAVNIMSIWQEYYKYYKYIKFLYKNWQGIISNI